MWGSGNIGSSSGINFKIICSESVPVNPIENTIWIKSSLEMNGWAFSPDIPETKEDGLIWITTGNNGLISFNALKRNEIKLYPTATSQYDSKNWVTKKAQIYKNGVWNDLEIWFYNNGDECTAKTGGYINAGGQYSVVENTESFIRIYTKYADTNGAMTTNNAVNLSNINKIYFKVDSNSLITNKNSIPASVGIHTDKSIGSSTKIFRYSKVEISEEPILYSIDVSDLTGEYYIVARGYRSSGHAEMNISEIYGK